jgi:hypothetical protein
MCAYPNASAPRVQVRLPFNEWNILLGGHLFLAAAPSDLRMDVAVSANAETLFNALHG